MNKLKPHRLANLDFWYKCVKCGAEHPISLSEASVEDFKFVCFCGAVNVLEKIRNIKVVYNYEEKHSSPVTNSLAIVKLLEMGFSKEELLPYNHIAENSVELTIQKILEAINVQRNTAR